MFSVDSDVLPGVMGRETQVVAIIEVGGGGSSWGGEWSVQGGAGNVSG